MTGGSEINAITRLRPPQSHFKISTRNTRHNNSAQVSLLRLSEAGTDARFSPSGHRAPCNRLPLDTGTTSERNVALGANTPWVETRFE